MFSTALAASPVQVSVAHFVGTWDAAQSYANASVLERVDEYVAAAVCCGLDEQEISADLAAEFSEFFASADVKLFTARKGLYAEVTLSGHSA